MTAKPYECSVCYEPYNTTNKVPSALLPCAHSVCTQCLARLKQMRNPCPICKAVVKGSHINEPLLALLLEEEGQTSAKPCPIHDRKMELWCKEDKCFACAQCYITEHRGHKVTSYEEAVEYREMLDAASKAIAVGEAEKERTKAKQEGLLSRCDACRSDVEDFFTLLTDSVKVQCDMAKASTEKSAESELLDLQCDLDTTKASLAQLRSSKASLIPLFSAPCVETSEKRKEALELFRKHAHQDEPKSLTTSRVNVNIVQTTEEKFRELLNAKICGIIRTQEQEPVGKRCLAEGRGLQSVWPCRPASFRLVAMDGRGRRVRSGEKKIEVLVNNGPCRYEVSDCKDGTYLVTYFYSEEPQSVPHKGEVCILLNGELVGESPYKVECMDYIGAGTYSRSLGSYGTIEGQFLDPSSLVIDGDTLIVADAGSHRLQVISRVTGEHIYFIGSEGNGPGEFKAPSSLALDGDFLYVLERDNRRIQVLEKVSGEHIFFIPLDQLPCPLALAVDDSFIYVADTSRNKVVVFDKVMAGAALQEISGTGPGSSSFNSPVDLAIDSSKIYISDRFNNRVEVYNKGTCDYHMTIGKQGKGQGELENVNGIFIAGSRLYACDRYNKRINVYDKEDGSFLFDFGKDTIGRANEVIVDPLTHEAFVIDGMQHCIHAFK